MAIKGITGYIKLYGLLTITVLFYIVTGVSPVHHDTTFASNSKGQEVARHSLDVLLHRCLITPREYIFLLRLAYLMSDFGSNINSTENPYYGGMWKVDKDIHNFMKTDEFYKLLKDDIKQINKTLKIDWTNTQWKDLSQPLYSAIATKLYMKYQSIRNSDDLPPSAGQQANYVFQYFRAPGNQADFIVAAEKIHQRCHKALDLVFVFESTDEMKMVNFHRAKELIKETCKFFHIGKSNTRIGVVTLAGSPYIHSKLSDFHTEESLNEAIDRIIFTGGMRENGFSISLLQEMFLEKNGARPMGGFEAKVLVVVLPPDVDSDYEVELVKSHMRNYDVSIVKVRLADHPLNMVDPNALMLSEEAIHSMYENDVEHQHHKRCRHEFFVKHTSYLPNIAALISDQICEAPVFLPARDHFGPVTGQVLPESYEDFVVRVTKFGTSVDIMGSRSSAMLYMTSSSKRPTTADHEIKLEVYPYRRTLISIPHPSPDNGKDVDVHFSIYGQGPLPAKLSLVISGGAKDVCHAQPCLNDKICTLEGALKRCKNTVVKIRNSRRKNISHDARCAAEVTDWSECSVTCDMGVSTRLAVDTKTCVKVLQKRSCYIRPCDMVEEPRKKKCRAARKMERSKVTLDGCESELSYRLKICGVCTSLNRCCVPERSKTIKVPVTCHDGTSKSELFMKILKCKCHEEPCE